MATGQAGFGAGFKTYAAGFLAGRAWDTGSVMWAAGFTRTTPVEFDYDDRPFLYPDQRSRGGRNFLSYSCSPATIQPQGQSTIFLSPTAPSPVANNTDNAPCDNQPYGERIGQETRYNTMLKVDQQVSDSLRVFGDVIYSDRRTLTHNSRGGIQATVFRTGPQANPFYVNPPGVTPGTTAGDRQTVRWQADDLLGPGAYTLNQAQTWIMTANAEYKINDNWRFTLMALAGEDRTSNVSEGSLCSSCAALALNGTTSTGGSMTTPPAGVTVIPLNLPLTAANALDVWNPAATNRTSAAVRQALIDNRTDIHHISKLKQFRAGIDGSLFELPAGAVRVAIGGELQDWVLNTTVIRPLNTGGASTGSSQRYFPLDRQVQSAYGELLVPLISPEQGSFLHSADFNISGRYDNYSDFGDTFNPKVAASVEFIPGFKLRGNWARSFVAPSMRSVGDPLYGTYSNSTAQGNNPTNTQVSIARFPTVAQIPGIPCANGFCTLGTGIQGIVVDTGNPNVGPQKGTTWSVGFDFAPEFAPGLRASVTLFNNKLRGGITSPCAPGCILNNGALNYLLTIYPNGATPAEIAAQVNDVPVTSAFPATVYFAFRRPQTNALDLDVQGLDIAADYTFDTSAGQFSIGGSISEFLKFDQGFAGGAKFDILNTVGVSSTFPSIKRQARANVGWERDRFSVQFFVNHVGSYKNWGGGTLNPLVLSPEGNVTGGGDIVKSWTTFDFHASMDVLDQSEVYIDISNFTNEEPPFANNSAGYDTFGSNPVGRVVSLGFRARF
jgi:iron complex outermembrane receptor protein